VAKPRSRADAIRVKMVEENVSYKSNRHSLRRREVGISIKLKLPQSEFENDC
jgi:hypothetical protein